MAARSFKQELVAVFGDPVAENPTQVMMEAAFADLGLDWRYLTIEVRPSDLGDAVRGAKACGFRGFNCTARSKCWRAREACPIAENGFEVSARRPQARPSQRT